MSTSPLLTFWGLFTTVLRRGTPVLGLELHIHGRQRRTFIFRCLYVAMLTVYIGLMWQAVVENARTHLSEAAAQSVMSDAGRTIVGNVILFQFVAGQVAAIALMCTAFTAEMTQGRLPALLTTPLSPVQIVAGKYLSRLVQLLVLMLATLPVLAIVRVFGGVPWWDLVLGTLFTAVAAMFTGAVTLLASIRQAKSHVAAMRGAIASVVLLAVFGLRLSVDAVYLYPVVMVILGVGIGSVGLMCIADFPLAVQRVIGQPLPTYLAPSDKSYANYAWLPDVPEDPTFRSPFKPSLQAAAMEAPMESVQGDPLVWRATRQLNKAVSTRTVAMAIGMLLFYVYGGALAVGGLSAAGFHSSILVILLAVITLWAGFLAATCVTADKETGQWPLLLTTPMASSSIFMQKFRVIMGRSWMLWAAVSAHALIFVVAGILHPLALVQLPILFAWHGVFVIALGVYASAHSRTSSSAAILTGAVLTVLWLVVPVTAGLISRGVYDGSDSFGSHVLSWVSAGNPFTQLSATLSGDIRSEGQFHPLQWMSGQTTLMGMLEYVMQWLFWLVAYTLAGAILLWRAVRSFRRNVYE